MRAFETTPTAAWNEADAAWASREALRVEGEHSSFERFLVRRAELGAARLGRHDASLAMALRSQGRRAWLAWGAVCAGVALPLVRRRLRLPPVVTAAAVVDLTASFSSIDRMKLVNARLWLAVA